MVSTRRLTRTVAVVAVLLIPPAVAWHWIDGKDAIIDRPTGLARTLLYRQTAVDHIDAVATGLPVPHHGNAGDDGGFECAHGLLFAHYEKRASFLPGPAAFLIHE